MTGCKGFKPFKGFKGFKRLRAGKRQAWTPIRSHWCVALGCLLAAGWSMANGRLGPPWRVVRALSLLRVFKGFKGLRAGKRQAWTPIRSHWCVALGCLLAAGWSMANGRLGPPWRVVRVLSLLRVFKGFKGFKGLRAGKRQAWTPIRSHWCVALGCLLAAGWSMANGRLGPPMTGCKGFKPFEVLMGVQACRLPALKPLKPLKTLKRLKALTTRHGGPSLPFAMLHPAANRQWSMANGRLGPPWQVVRVLSRLRVFKGFKRLRAGKRQAWTPIRSHWCVALGCRLGGRMKHGKQQAWTPMPGCKGRPKEAIDVWPWGACWMQDEAWQTAGLDPHDGL